MKKGREYHVCGEEYSLETGERISNIIFPTIFRLWVGKSSRRKGKGTEFSGKKIKILKNEGEEYQVAGNIIRPL